MDTDKLVFGIIGGITLLITAVIVFTSFSTQKATDLRLSEVIGNDPHRRGPENAKLTIIEFSDFECPYCGQYEPVLQGMIASYPDNLAIVYRHFPLPMHTGAMPAALASEAAAKQNKFWEYHDELFANQPNFKPGDLEGYAQKLGLNVDQFKKDSVSEEVAKRVQSDADYGRSLNITATPSFYISYDGKVEVVKLLKYGDLEEKVKSILGDPKTDAAKPTNTGTKTDADGNQTSQDGPTMTAQAPEGMPGLLPMNVTLDIINVQRKDKLAPSQVSINTIEKADWPDAGLGCPEAGKTYAQVVTPGYKVLASGGDEVFEYHSDAEAKTVVFCKATPKS